MTNAPGKKFLKVTGILFIICGILTIVLSAVMLFGGMAGVNALGGMETLIAETASEAGMESGTEALAGVVSGVLIAALVIAIISGVFQLITGILGVKYCNRPDKAMVLIVLAAIILVVSGVGMILNFDASILGTVVVTVLYLIGAIKNKKAR